MWFALTFFSFVFLVFLIFVFVGAVYSSGPHDYRRRLREERAAKKEKEAQANTANVVSLYYAERRANRKKD